MRNKIGRIGAGMAVAAAVGAGLWAAVARGDLITHGATTIDMAFVDIGNAWNAADSTGYGGVGYNFSIGKYEVSQDQWDAVNTAAGIADAGGTWTGSQPVADISWHNAALFCNWLTTGNAYSGYYAITGTGDSATAVPNALSHDAYAAANGPVYFLPTEDEWYKAAYYNSAAGNYYQYPTGSDTAPTAVASGTTVGTAVYGGGAVTAPADVNLSGGLSPYLTMGQGGNVWEWNETLIGGNRGLRGGWLGNIDIGLWSGYRLDFDPAGEDGSVGFRVASIVPVIVPEPASALLLVLPVLGLMARRRR